jgi:hypothetical protein
MESRAELDSVRLPVLVFEMGLGCRSLMWLAEQDGG